MPNSPVRARYEGVDATRAVVTAQLHHHSPAHAVGGVCTCACRARMPAMLAGDFSPDFLFKPGADSPGLSTLTAVVCSV